MKSHCTENTTLLSYLEKFFDGASRSTIRKKLAQKSIYVNGSVVVNALHPLQVGDEVACQKPYPTLEGEIPILYEDEEVIVVVKPAGLLSVDTDTKIHSLHRLIKRHVSAPIVYPVHRLDRETSGLIVFALTPHARDALKEQLAARTMTRIYRAVIHGKLPKKKGTIEIELLETKNLSMKIVSEGGKRAVTHYRVLEEYRKTTLVECRLETGKKHQIRVSFAHLGTPIVGDTQYGAPEGAKRMMLHACTLLFEHPTTGKLLRFEKEL